MKRMKTLGSLAVVSTAAIIIAAASGAGCLTRPVSQQAPTTKVNFNSTVKQAAVDKIDLLFVIDNSASMGDKQDILADAVPDLIKRLVTPNCIDSNTFEVTGEVADPLVARDKQCPSGQEPEFKPVTDLHLAVISTSLGSLGASIVGCDDNTPEENDKGHIINRTDDGSAVPEFLAWFPKKSPLNEGKTAPKDPIEDLTELNGAFSKVVRGVKQTGCGLEAQLESWYHFLVAPDPWEKIVLDTDKNGVSRAKYSGVDKTILKQRKEFLRKDSLVGIILLTDEDDSIPDPLSISGQGYQFLSDTQGFFKAPTICATKPGDPKCASCGFVAPGATCTLGTDVCNSLKNDPNCKSDSPSGSRYSVEEDRLNSRFFKMKQRYGDDPQYPISRYVDGLKSFRVPNGASEHNSAGRYIGTPACTNPLFASDLPDENTKDVCNLPRGPRSPDLVYFATIGGVPNQIIFDCASDDPAKPVDCSTKEATPKYVKVNVNESNGRWTKVLGKDPLKFDYTGIDPHMVQSKDPRADLEGPPGDDNASFGENGADPIHGRDYTTAGQDLQYACTFPLKTPVPCTNVNSCDCAGPGVGGVAPPLCSKGTPTAPVGDAGGGGDGGGGGGGGGGNFQVRAKAYPTVREFEVVRALKDQGIIASLCPITLDPTAKDDVKDPSYQFYGYRPAVNAIVERLKNALANQCLPEPLTRDEGGNVPCLILETFTDKPAGTSCSKLGQGLEEVDPKVLVKFREQLKQNAVAEGDAGIDDSERPVCQVKQIAINSKSDVTCAKSKDAGWCYVVNTSDKSPAGTCSQAILFSPAANPGVGVRVSLQCIQQFSEGQAADGEDSKSESK